MAILPEERRKKMLELLNENGSVTIEELARRFGVSEMTIRRDLDKYRRVGQVKRCRGGAVLRGDNVGEVEYQKKISTNLETKQRIAAYCAGLVTEGMQVFLDAGTTVFYIARELLAVHYVDGVPPEVLELPSLDGQLAVFALLLLATVAALNFLFPPVPAVLWKPDGKD